MKVFLQSIVAQLLLNPYVFLRGWQGLEKKKSWRIPFIICFALELTVYFAGFFFYKTLPDGLMITIMHICGTWYVGLIYTAIALIGIDVLRVINSRWRWYPKIIVDRWKETKLSLFVLLLCSVGGLLVYAYNKVSNPVVTHVSLSLPRGSGNVCDSMTVVLISDLHIGEVISKKFVRKYVALNNAQEADLCILAGDLVDYESRFAEAAHIEDDLRKLKAKWGVYAVNGNHEYRANRHAKRKWIEKTGAVLLVDSVVLINDSFYLVGRDDDVNKRRKPLNAIVRDLEKDKPMIVIDHQPNSLNELLMNGAALGLHGHTHNGQLWPYPLVMKFVYECPYGLYKKGNTLYYVSSGIGIAGPPYRVGTVSELVVLHIRFI